MKEIITDFLMQEKMMNGMPASVDKAEIAKVQCAFLAVKGHYPERQHVQILKVCCDTIIEAEKKKISAPISLMISQFSTGENTVGFDTVLKTFHK